jgi:aminoglycoside phosphotransferase (APT) family kinase protein
VELTMPCVLDLAQVASRFQIPGRYLGAAPHGAGHINETWAATWDQGGCQVRYILQRLNTNIFKDPKGLMANVAQVTAHLHHKLLAQGATGVHRRALSLVPAIGGGLFLEDPDLGFWRVYRFVEGARTFDLLEHEGQAYQAARAFGAFQSLLADYDGPRLTETIPSFHHTPRRFQALRQAIREDAAGRVREALPEIDYALGQASLTDRLTALQGSGLVPERITHNDTKLNNVMLDDETGEGLCVIDLDTVMPGLSLFDFGDMVRTACNPVPEDHPRPEEAVARQDMFLALAAGYLQGTGGALLPVEREHLAVAGQLLTYECGIRFLTDFLQGDPYFRIHRPAHNLDRCRTQFALARSLEAQGPGFMKAVRDLP